VTLLAPRAAGEVLVGPGSGRASRLFAWERCELAAALAAGDPRALPAELAGLDAALVYSRSAGLARAFAGCRVVVHDPDPQGVEHASWHLARPLAALGAAIPDELPSLVPDAASLEAAAPLLSRLPEPFLALHPGSGSARKNWPAERFLALAAAASPGRPWLLVSGPADEEASAPLVRHAGAVASGLSASALGALLARAGTFVGNDSGVSHLAAAFGAPTLALFGPTDPALWAPVGARVAVLRSETGRMQDLPAEPVLDAVRALREAG
jgi:ADP-heptose:LPS heptosyltransferase